MKPAIQPRNIQGDRITIQNVGSETLVYDERSHRAWCLNRSAACIWRLSDGRSTVAEIAARAAMELGSPISSELVLLTLAELREKELLHAESVTDLPQDISRREMIGKAGLAAAALLPLIASLTAPPAAAQSGSVGTNAKRRSPFLRQ